MTGKDDASIANNNDNTYMTASFWRTNAITNFLLIRRTSKVMLAVGVLAILFSVYYNSIAIPSNFGSLTNTFWYFIPALATLLSIAVIFNNFILNNEMRAMPSDIQTITDQTSKITKLLEPIRKCNSLTFNQATRSSTAGLYYMIKATTDAAKDTLETDHEEELRSICTDFVDASNHTMKLYRHTKDQFTLVMIPTADLIIRTILMSDSKMLSEDDNNNNIYRKQFSQTLFGLHALKSMLAGIYIRRSVQ